jgi:DNA-binding LacI/PurR family transcriptional regulator
MLINLGHKNIVCFCDPADTEFETSNHMLGHIQAMDDANLALNDQAWKRSLQIQEGDLSAVRSYLEEFSDATAIVCMWGGMASTLVSVAGMMNIKVPEDLSITAHGSCPLVSKPGETMTCLEYDVDALIQSSIDLLREQQISRQVKRTRVLGNPVVHQGASVAPPKK